MGDRYGKSTENGKFFGEALNFKGVPMCRNSPYNDNRFNIGVYKKQNLLKEIMQKQGNL